MLLGSRCLAELRAAPSYTLWRGVAAIRPLSPSEVLAQVDDPLQVVMRRMKPHCFEVCPPNELLAAWNRGLSVQFRHAEHVWPELARLSAEVSEATDLECDGVGTIWSRAGIPGSGPHTDRVHVLAVQLEGLKRWRRQADQGGLVDITLHPGDALWVHAGDWHECLPVTDCLHAAIRMKA